MLSEHKHCDNAATTLNSENARSRIGCRFAGKCGYGDTGRRVKYWACLGCWISPCYGPFPLGARFETYEPFIYLIFQILSGCGKPRITEIADTESTDTGSACMCVCVYIVLNRKLWYMMLGREFVFFYLKHTEYWVVPVAIIHNWSVSPYL